jgi:hypothetical protein
MNSWNKKPVYVLDGGFPRAVDGDIQVLYVNGSLIVGYAGFTIHRYENSPAGILTAELTTFVAVGMGCVGFFNR